MTGIFISYRREDSGPYAGRLYDALVSHFGQEGVFFDIDTIGPGEDFREVIQKTCSSCKVLLAVIGRQWATVCDKNGKMRLQSKNDTLRMEIASALQHGLRVIPVLVGGAEMPDESALPEDLQALAYRNAWDLSDKRFHNDVELLVEALKKTLGAALQNTSVSAPPKTPPSAPKKKPTPAKRPRKETSTTSSRSLLSPRSTTPSLFPLFGIALGKTSKDEIAKIGRKTTSGKGPICYQVKGIDFWYDEGSNSANFMYLVESLTDIPESWQELGFRWEKSYDEWLSVLEDLEYSIKVKERPHTKQWQGHDSFSARVIAEKSGMYPHSIELNFSYSEGTTTGSAKTLYSLSIRNTS